MNTRGFSVVVVIAIITLKFLRIFLGAFAWHELLNK